MRLILIRHAESKHSQNRLIAAGASCPGLTDHGFQQARQLAERLELQHCDLLLSSPVLRAYQTAQILAEKIGKPIEQNSDLRELDPGDAEGLTWPDYDARYGAFDLLAYPTRPIAPNGESWSDFMGRIRATHEQFAQKYQGQTVIAVTHGGFIVASLFAVFDIPRPGTGARLETANTSLTEWRVSENIWTLERFNDTTHLAKPS